MSRKRFACLDCGIDTSKAGEFYMLRDQVWLAANPAGEGMLCIGCLESRLGRSLLGRDFTDCFLNRPGGLNGMSGRLGARLAA